ncbi:hypothetical protein PanWU01x14_173970 [Parasponia andersonii]|uniref:Uncharacterized protein n=1 Tax=Parasponia andersonii TaxID=3476 RepID=A0A2P5C920_PARAD|nr:hypothetical protein PanWU01x14_173970 [Parasponia andersonii]
MTKEGKGVVRPELLTWFRLTTESKHRVPLFREFGVVLGRVVKRNSRWVREKQSKVLVGGAESSQRGYFGSARPRFGFIASGWVFGAD